MEEVDLEGGSLKSEKNLMDIPSELFDHIFSKLSLNDLLRLRRVSKQMKPLAEDYLRLHGNSSKFFHVNLSDDEALSALLEFNFVAPYSKFSIGDVKDEMWGKRGIQEFVEIYGDRITHLKIDSIEIPIVSQKAVRFFESLPNLKNLEIFIARERKKKTSPEARASDSKEFVQLIPSSFKRLESLIIEEYCRAEVLSLESVEVLWQFVEACSAQLQFLKHPEIVFNHEMDLGDQPGGRFGCVRRILGTPNQSRLKFYDLYRFYDDSLSAIQNFYDLVTTCAKHGVKLLNVTAFYIEEMMELETRDEEQHGSKISSVVVSLLNLEKLSFLLELPLLEEIHIEKSSKCTIPSHLRFQKAWPALKKLSIDIDSDHLPDYDAQGGSDIISVTTLFDYFFIGITREKMEDLKLVFTEEIFSPPRMIDVSRSCPNLRVLFLSQWPGNNQEISELWTNLPLLEKVTFSNCSVLGRIAFIGNDSQNPAFFQANNLRSLTLEGLENMPNITDSFFTQVLRHKPLAELHLHSNKTIRREKITKAGILSLLDGVFAETIECLGLNIQLKGVTARELKKLEKKFRSWKML